MLWRTYPKHEELQRSCKFRWRLSVKAIEEDDRVYKVLHWCAAAVALKRERLQRSAADRNTNLTLTAAAKRVTALRSLVAHLRAQHQRRQAPSAFL